jgi:NAD(P)-dependent dehydrogenase (short-subunit alcohol dehydrogenase family)
MELEGKVAIITGSTGGMGKSIAELFAREGASVVVHGRDSERGNALVKHFEDLGGKACFVQGDIALPETNQRLVEEAIAKFGRLDIIVANAGMLGLGSVTGMEEALWHKTVDVNLSSIFYLCRYGITAMTAHGGGTIIVNSSIAAFKSFPNHPAYCASKAAAVALTKQIALDYGPEIRANAICAGPVDTPLIWESAVAFADPKKAVANAGLKTAMKRLGLPVDIAHLALFLASEKSSWMTGSAVTIDGGATIN